jgi:MoaA/NifB/PqqE/SkfB family radical SAM enzyme
MATSTLILTVTRACNLRCVYCPTVKDDWPSLSADDARRGLDLFAERGGGDVKLFGGEPLLVPDVVRAVMDHATTRPEIRRVYLSTNGLGLTPAWLDYLRGYPKAILTISLDGKPEDNRNFRRPAEGDVPDAYDHVVALLPELRTVPRVVITQTIPPTTAGRAAENFRHLAGLGFWRFNLLPGYYIPWTDKRLQELRVGFDGIRDEIVARWERGEKLYLRNLFTWQPTPFFNTGFVVDADGTIHPSNVGLSGALEGLLGQTRCGSLDDPPSAEVLEAKAREVNGLLERSLPPRVWASTLAVDAELTRLCRSLYPHYARYRAARREVAA